MTLSVLLLVSMIGAQDAKIDSGLADVEGHVPIFVRMDDQLFKKGGDYDEFCKQNEDKKRSALRKETLATLKSKADSSWEKTKALVAKLEKDGAIKETVRFWIVNGFACDANSAAIKELARSEQVSFVYRQTGPQGFKQNRNPVPPLTDARQKATKAMLDRQHEDGAFTTHGMEIPWNLKQVQADLAWKEGFTGKGVVVAINDGGMYDNACFDSALWRNTKETIDGKDEDNNGYVDDVFGIDANTGNGYVFGIDGAFHGTMCAGIVAGRPTSEKPFISGVAPRAKLMVINGMGHLRALEYAFVNGADVVSMSFMWVNIDLGNFRGVFRLAAEHMTAAGVLGLGGAGNFATTAPEGKQITLPKDIPCFIAVAGTQEDGTRPVFSSKGPVSWSGVKFYDDDPKNKPDVSAPASGFLVWARADGIRPQWTVEWRGKSGDALIKGPQGNSFAGPHAAGVAALMFEANPELNAWQVKRIIEQTSKDIGKEGFDFEHGHGLVQAHAAVQAAKKIKK
jgi:subtilisin family serine protease